VKLERFHPPGFLDDFNDEQRATWSEWISDRFDEGVRGKPERFEFDAPRAQFYNPMKVETGPDAQSVDISWVGFPRGVETASISDIQRWRRADEDRDRQDEYCEWSVERDPDSGKITRVTFTCEGPEYWSFLAETTPEVALDLYQQFVNPQVKLDDLFRRVGSDRKYNPRNKWNESTVEGAMHLIQVNNNLSAEIELAAGSSVVRKIGGRILDGEQELIKCGHYGGAGRHSDPHIGGQVNSLTRQKADVTLENPVGLYFSDLSTESFETQDGSDPKSFWTYVRGTEEKPVRAVYEVPADKGYTVSDVTIEGRPIVFGAQIADFVTIKLTGVATRFGQSTVAPMTGCRRDKALDEDVSLESFAVGSALDLDRMATR
jgi:hypothetical protein